MIQGQLGSLTSSAPSGPSWEAKRDEARLWKILSKGYIGAIQGPSGLGLRGFRVSALGNIIPV